jgi:hypothetical protein
VPARVFWVTKFVLRVFAGFFLPCFEVKARNSRGSSARVEFYRSRWLSLWLTPIHSSR